MDGFTLLKELQQLLQETSTSSWANCKTGYDYIYQASRATYSRTGILTGSQAITTVAGTSAYTLNADFLRLYLMDEVNRHIVKFTKAAGTVSFLHFSPYDSLFMASNTTSVSTPNRFSITDATPGSQLTGTTTSAGAKASTYTLFNETLGEATLTNSPGGGFTNTVNIGDTIHNTTDTSHGYVVALSSGTAIITALFDGTDNDYTSGDAYIINPQLRFQIVIDPPPSANGDTITVPYVKRAAPVYSAYRSYPLPSGLSPALVHYAAWLYKYRDREPSFGDGFYKYWDHECSIIEENMDKAKTGGVKLRNKLVNESSERVTQKQGRK